MKDLLIKAVANKEAVCALLGAIDPKILQSGQVLLTPAMLGNILKLAGDGSTEFSNISMESGGVRLDIRTKSGISLRYVFRLQTAVVSWGQIILKARYSEEKLSGGLGSALMNLSGKSGIALAFGKKDGVHIDSGNIEINRRGIPEFIKASYLRAAPAGLVFSVD